MSKYSSLRELHTAIADEVRAKTGSTDGIAVEDLPEAVKAIESAPKIYAGNKIHLNSTDAVNMIRNIWGIQGKAKIILADDLVPSTYEVMVMWLDEDNAGVAECHNRGWELFGPSKVGQTRMFAHNYWVMPVDTIPAKPTT